MGNECPACETPINACTVRDVLKEQNRQRDDLDLQHIKKGQYKRKSNLKENNETIVKDAAFPLVIDQTKKVKALSPQQLQGEQSQGYRKLTFSQSIILINLEEKVMKSKQMNKKQNPTLSKHQVMKKSLTLDSSNKVVTLKKGVTYTGGVIDQQPHEKGKITWDDKTVLHAQFFLGQLVQNQKIRVQFNDNTIYEGRVQEGKGNGVGKVIFSDETYYEGQFKDDFPHGFGKHKMSDGTFYEGMFNNGLKNGKGKYYFEDGMYEGQFYNDMFHGQGILILNDGRNIRGVWNQGNLEGKGQMEWETGQKYVGNFHGYERQGQGTFYFADGRQWTGQWKNDLQNGFGCYQSKGQLIKSIWVNGLKTQQLREIDLNRNG